jgi:photosystem II stability/assembly factor-like uncharacterized protein
MSKRQAQDSMVGRPWLWIGLCVPIALGLVWNARGNKVAERGDDFQGGGRASPKTSEAPAALELPLHVYNPHFSHIRVAPDGSAILAFGSEGAAVRSTDDGQSFQSLSVPTRQFLAASIADPRSGSMIVIGGGGTILRSSDMGQNFVPVRVDTEQSFRAIAVSAAGTQEVLAVGDAGMAYVSRDGGRSFESEATPRGDYLSQVVALPKRARFVVGGDNGALLVRDPSTGWRDVTLSSGLTKEAGLVMSLGVLPSGKLLAGTQSGLILSSEDDGESWREIYRTGTDSFVASFEPSDSGLLVAARMRRGDVLLSSDQGTTFEATSITAKPGVATLSWSQGSFVGVANDGSVLKSDSTGKRWSSAPSPVREGPLAMATHPITGTVIVAGRSGLIARSTDRGLHYQVVNPGLAGSIRAFADNSAAGCLVGVGMSATVVRSVDAGKSWQRQPLAIDSQVELTSVAVEPKSRALLAGGSAGTLLRSTDCARTWLPIRAAKGDVSFVEASENGTLVILPAKSPILRSTDAGATFGPSDMDADATLKRVIAVSANEWVAVGEGGRAYRSADDAKSFLRIATGSEANLRALAYDRIHRVLWAAGDGGTVLRSTDGGATWNRIAVPTQENLFAVGLDSQGDVVWLGGNRGAVLRSADQGAHFESVKSGTSQTIRVIAFDPPTKEFLFTGAAGTLLRTVSGERIVPIEAPLEGRIDAALFHSVSAAWFLGGERLVRLGGG